MLSFLWHLRGSIALNSPLTDAQIIAVVADWLDDEGKGVPERDRNMLWFSEPFWHVTSRRSIVSIFDRGHFRIVHGLEGRRLCYDLRSLHVALHLSAFAAIAVLFFRFTGGGVEPGRIFGMVAALYGVNMIFAVWRVPRMIRKAIGSA